MTPDMLLVFGLLAVAVVLFVTEWLPLDLVAVLVVLALMLTGLLTPAEALAGFADPLVLIIAGLFVVGAGLFNTGVADGLGAWLARVAGTDETRLIAVIMLIVALLSAFLSSTGTVAIFLPVVVSLAAAAQINPSKLLIPLAYASLLGGMLTLIGTPPNLAVNSELRRSGLEQFGFFDFTLIGLVMLLIGIGFMLLVGRRLIPSRASVALSGNGAAPVSLTEMATAYRLPGNLFRMRVRPASPLVGQSLAESELANRHQVRVLQVQSWSDRQRAPAPVRLATADTRIASHDILYVEADPEAAANLAREQQLGLLPVERSSDQPLAQELDLVEVLLPPRSALIGRTLRDARLRAQYGVTVIAIQRLGRPLAADLANTPLTFGDTLLVGGTREAIERLSRRQGDFVVVGEVEELQNTRGPTGRAPVAIAIMLAMLILLTTGLVPNVAAVLLAATAMVLSGCLKMEDVYRRMSWESVVLIAGMIPLATALEQTGGVAFIAGGLSSGLGEFGPLALMIGLFLLTSLFSQFISNTATTLLIAPIAVQVATTAELSPYPLLMAVAVAASTAFSTPVASPVNTLVLGPGGYRFADFARAGVPLQLLVLAATLLVVPLLFPFK